MERRRNLHSMRSHSWRLEKLKREHVKQSVFLFCISTPVIPGTPRLVKTGRSSEEFPNLLVLKLNLTRSREIQMKRVGRETLVGHMRLCHTSAHHTSCWPLGVALVTVRLWVPPLSLDAKGLDRPENHQPLRCRNRPSYYKQNRAHYGAAVLKVLRSFDRSTSLCVFPHFLWFLFFWRSLWPVLHFLPRFVQITTCSGARSSSPACKARRPVPAWDLWWQWWWWRSLPPPAPLPFHYMTRHDRYDGQEKCIVSPYKTFDSSPSSTEAVLSGSMELSSQAAAGCAKLSGLEKVSNA